MKKAIKLTESDLHNIIKESVNKILAESGEYTEKNFDLPKGSGKYALAGKAAWDAWGKQYTIGPNGELEYNSRKAKQGENFASHAADAFKERFGIHTENCSFELNNSEPTLIINPLNITDRDTIREIVNNRKISMCLRMNGNQRRKINEALDTYEKAVRPYEDWSTPDEWDLDD